MFLMLTLYMQQVLGYSAMKAGVAYLAVALSAIVWSAVAAQLVTRVGIKPVLVTGMTMLTAGLVEPGCAAPSPTRLVRTVSRVAIPRIRRADQLGEALTRPNLPVELPCRPRPLGRWFLADQETVRSQFGEEFGRRVRVGGRGGPGAWSCR
jgi:hypothetical protein